MKRGGGPCAKYLVGEDGRLCPICGLDYMGDTALSPFGCRHIMRDLEDWARRKAIALAEQGGGAGAPSPRARYVTLGAERETVR